MMLCRNNVLSVSEFAFAVGGADVSKSYESIEGFIPANDDVRSRCIVRPAFFPGRMLFETPS